MTETHIRWMATIDLAAVLAIEDDSFLHPWSESDFRKCLRTKEIFGVVAQRGYTAVGYMLYQLHSRRIHVLNLAVAAAYQRQGIAGEMVARLASSLSDKGRACMLLQVSEANLGGQLFFRRQGFKAVAIIKDYYDNGQAAYQFRMLHGETAIQTTGAR